MLSAFLVIAYIRTCNTYLALSFESCGECMLLRKIPLKMYLKLHSMMILCSANAMIQHVLISLSLLLYYLMRQELSAWWWLISHGNNYACTFLSFFLIIHFRLFSFQKRSQKITFLFRFDNKKENMHCKRKKLITQLVIINYIFVTIKERDEKSHVKLICRTNFFNNFLIV